MSVTIKDIARLANISHATVSRALNNSPLVNQDTKEKIMSIAKELNYIPNYNAKSLVLNKSYHIGLFFSSINQGPSAHIFYEIIKGVNNVIKDQYNLIVKGIDEYQDFSRIDRKVFDGIIVMSQSMKDMAFIYHIIEKKIPLVVLNRELKEDNVINILCDDNRGAYRAIEYLITMGHKKIGFIEGKEEFKSSLERKTGYMDALMDYGLPIYKKFIVKGNYDIDSGYRAMKQMLENEEYPTAVFCSNDDMAVGAMKAIREKNLSVPQDISIIGFDDNIFSNFLTPALTTVQRPIGKIGEAGAQALIQFINKDNVENDRIFISTELIERESVRAV
ncbi:MAG: LacI family DNA-binding transcriptional regulator [Thermotaleaceae bacterium]